MEIPVFDVDVGEISEAVEGCREGSRYVTEVDEVEAVEVAEVGEGGGNGGGEEAFGIVGVAVETQGRDPVVDSARDARPGAAVRAGFP